jgi:hypothetical protein
MQPGGSILPTNPKANPIFQRLTRHPNAPPTLRQSAWLAGGLGGVGLILGLSRFFIDPDTVTVWSILYLLLTGLPYIVARSLYPLISLFGAVVAASITGRDASTDLYPLMRLTPVTGTDIVWGYILAALYRLRVWLALMIALLPALMFGEKLVMDSVPLPLLSELGIQLALTIGMWGVFLFGIVVGVSEGLLHKKVFPGVVAAPLVVVVFWGATGLACGYMSVARLLQTPTVGVPFSFFSLRLGRAALPYLLSLLFFRLACLWA